MTRHCMDVASEVCTQHLLTSLLDADAELCATEKMYGAVWEGSVPTAPPLDLQISSSGQQLVLRCSVC